MTYTFLTRGRTSPALKMQEERTLHEAKLAKMEAEMNLVFQQKVQEKEAKLKQSEEELYARHREMKEALEKQRLELEDKKRKIESGRPLTPEKANVRVASQTPVQVILTPFFITRQRVVGSFAHKVVISDGDGITDHFVVAFIPFHCYSGSPSNIFLVLHSSPTKTLIF